MNSWGSELASAFALRCLTGARRRGRLDFPEHCCRKKHSCPISAAVGGNLHHKSLYAKPQDNINAPPKLVIAGKRDIVKWRRDFYLAPINLFRRIRNFFIFPSALLLSICKNHSYIPMYIDSQIFL